MSKKKYLNEALPVYLENEEGGYSKVYIRAKLASASIPGVGVVDLPEWIKEQSQKSEELQKLVKSKSAQPAAVKGLQAKLQLPDLLQNYGPDSDNALFDLRTNEDDFPLDSVDEAEGEIAKLKEENEALKAEVAALKAENEALKAGEETDAGSEDSGK